MRDALRNSQREIHNKSVKMQSFLKVSTVTKSSSRSFGDFAVPGELVHRNLAISRSDSSDLLTAWNSFGILFHRISVNTRVASQAIRSRNLVAGMRRQQLWERSKLVTSQT